MARPTEYQFELLMQLEDGRRALGEISNALFQAKEGLTPAACLELRQRVDKIASDLQPAFEPEEEQR